jgi:hypothetical protein
MGGRLIGFVLPAMLFVDSLEAQSLRATEFLPPCMRYVEVFADGNIKDAITQAASVQSASGSIGVSFATDRTLASFLVNAVGSSPALRENFGASLLAPASGGSLSAGLIDVTFRPFVHYGKPETCDTPSKSAGLARRLAMRWYLSVSSAKWSYSPSDAAENDSELRDIGAVAIGIGAGFRYFFLNGNLNDTNAASPRQTQVSDLESRKPVAVYIDVGPAMRWLGGDIGSDVNAPIRQALFGPGRRMRIGLEVDLGVQFKGMKSGLTYYWFDGENTGFTDGQVIAGFSVQTALFGGFAFGGAEKMTP